MDWRDIVIIVAAIIAVIWFFRHPGGTWGVDQK